MVLDELIEEGNEESTEFTDKSKYALFNWSNPKEIETSFLEVAHYPASKWNGNDYPEAWLVDIVGHRAPLWLQNVMKPVDFTDAFTGKKDFFLALIASSNRVLSPTQLVVGESLSPGFSPDKFVCDIIAAIDKLNWKTIETTKDRIVFRRY